MSSMSEESTSHGCRVERWPNWTAYDHFVDSLWFQRPFIEKEMKGLFILTAGLGGETGEVLERLKKYVRDGKYEPKELLKELGDVLYYLTGIAHSFGFTLQDVIDGNVYKLTNRAKRGVLQGDGDNR